MAIKRTTTTTKKVEEYYDSATEAGPTGGSGFSSYRDGVSTGDSLKDTLST